jgi:pimeloyl-ACP methyl ester carboxylesterase
VDTLNQLGIKRGHFLGKSTGGMLGEILAANDPKRLLSLTVCSTPTHLLPAALQLFAFDKKIGQRRVERSVRGVGQKRCLAFQARFQPRILAIFCGVLIRSQSAMVKVWRNTLSFYRRWMRSRSPPMSSHATCDLSFMHPHLTFVRCYVEIEKRSAIFLPLRTTIIERRRLISGAAQLLPSTYRPPAAMPPKSISSRRTKNIWPQKNVGTMSPL